MPPLTLKLSTPLFFCLTLCGTLQAAPNAEAEAAFQRAVLAAEANAQWAERLIDQEQKGQLDKQITTEALRDIGQKHDAVEHDLRQASDGGHAVASYLLANLQERSKLWVSGQYTARHEQACALYQRAAEQGLVAAAVAVLRDCDSASQRFLFDDPTLQRQREQLRATLEHTDPYAEHYPLPALKSLCFKEMKMVAPDPGRPLTTLAQAFEPVQLDLRQYRADGYYLLAAKGDPEQPEIGRGHFTQLRALAPDCLDPIGLAYMYDAQRQKAH
jgi:hypothetical protein